MKDALIDANFPKTQDGRVYHLGIRAGEVANRIVTIGSTSRAHRIAAMLDAQPKRFELSSERGFLTITGRYKGVPVSIVCIGMGAPNVDFFIREVRECIEGDMAVIRLGSCGCLTDLPVGSLVLPTASVAVTRNFNYDFVEGDPWEVPYHVSRPVQADPLLHQTLNDALARTRPADSNTAIFADAVNASADSFYSSQGRQTSFHDHNSDLIENLKRAVPRLTTLEMETFYVMHLARSWRGSTDPSSASSAPPLTAGPVRPADPAGKPQDQHARIGSRRNAARASVIRAAAVHMVFASRSSSDFITPEKVAEAEEWTGRGVLEALIAFDVPKKNLHPEEGSVWDLNGN